MKTSAKFIGIVILISLLNSCIQKVEEPVTTTDPTKEIIVPEGNGRDILLDGIMSEGEWNDAFKVPLDNNINLFFKENDGFLYIAVNYNENVGMSINLYLSPADTIIYQFHISAQLVENILTPGMPDSLEPEWIMGKTSDWYANEIRWDYKKQKKIMDSLNMSQYEAFLETMFPGNAVEFQFKMSKFNSDSLKMKIDGFGGPEFKSLLEFPKDTQRKNLENWTTLVVR